MTPVASLVRWLAPSGRLTILIFHRVLAARDELWPDEWTASEFELICSWMGQWFKVLPLDEAAAALAGGRLPRHSACITFDDGYADNHHVALPILQRHGLCATFFVATGFLDGGRMWNDTVTEAVRRVRRQTLHLGGPMLNSLGDLPVLAMPDRRASLHTLIQKIKYLQPAERADALAELLDAAEVDVNQLPTDLMMRSDQVRGLRAAGMQVGAHTVSHPILATLGDEAARQEIVASRDVLQGILGEPVRLFAYPNGRPGQDYSARDVHLVRQLGFDAAVSTAPGVATVSTDPHQLPRFTPWDRSRSRFGLRLARQILSAQPSASV